MIVVKKTIFQVDLCTFQKKQKKKKREKNNWSTDEGKEYENIAAFIKKNIEINHDV